MLMIDLENNYYSASSLYAMIFQIIIMMLDRLCYVKVVSLIFQVFIISVILVLN